MQAILITHPVSGKVVGSFTQPPWLSQQPEESEELHMPLPLFLTLCGLVPFLLVSVLHVLYAYRCWPQYAQRWLGLLLLNILVIVPYANLLAFPLLLLWLGVALLRCRGARGVTVPVRQPSSALSWGEVSSGRSSELSLE
jgi:hypothetical protein